MNTATEGIAQLGPLMPGNVFTIADMFMLLHSALFKIEATIKINW